MRLPCKIFVEAVPQLVVHMWLDGCGMGGAAQLQCPSTAYRHPADDGGISERHNACNKKLKLRSVVSEQLRLQFGGGVQI